MTGAEIFIALVGILAGFSTCSQYATQVIEKIKKKRSLSRAVKQAELLGSSLRDSESTIGDQINNMSRLNRTTALGHGTSELSLTEAQSIMESLKSLLSPLASRTDITFRPNFSRYQNMANQSRQLTLEALHELTGHLISATSSTISLNSHPSLASNSTLVTSQSLMFGRTQLNFHNICKNARLYRENCYEFWQLTIAVPNNNHEKWTCKHCNIVVSEVSLRLSPSQDLIWMSASGMFKAHCAREPGRADGWTCIWPVVSPECRLRFDGEKQLLQHMKKCHVKLGTGGRKSTIDWPADIRHRSSDTCGFGANIGGQVMQNSEGCFSVPASAS